MTKISRLPIQLIYEMPWSILIIIHFISFNHFFPSLQQINLISFSLFIFYTKSRIVGCWLQPIM